ncbi:unnamed protein product [Parnassius mnemosyne]|uniref:Uncharacterized protein n=1 Tax=Parnassius mnemosyne TaxID=213953 RepID=A0AAV1L5R0_9NEOP
MVNKPVFNRGRLIDCNERMDEKGDASINNQKSCLICIITCRIERIHQTSYFIPQIYKMMCDGPSGNHHNYTPYPDHVVVEVTPLEDHENTDKKFCLKRVKLLNLVTNETTEVTVSLIVVLIGSRPDLFFLQTNFNLSNIDVKKDCIKCFNEQKQADKGNIDQENQRQCFLKSHWHYLKSVLGQSIQSCKSRYLNYTEINGNSDTKCIIPECNERDDDLKCKSRALEKVENGFEECKCEVIPYTDTVDRKVKCQCQPTNPYSSGLGFGIDPTKPVDGRSNPIAIDKSTHELLNAPKGIYALGPLTGDNFIRFIPGGALAIVADIHRQMKTTAE